jgi:hypothetical protein
MQQVERAHDSAICRRGLTATLSILDPWLRPIGGAPVEGLCAQPLDLRVL